jgi:hypothetical protein
MRKVRLGTVERGFVAPAKAGAQRWPRVDPETPLDSGLRRNDGAPDSGRLLYKLPCRLPPAPRGMKIVYFLRKVQLTGACSRSSPDRRLAQSQVYTSTITGPF